MTPGQQLDAIRALLKWDYDAAEGRVYFVQDGDIVGFDWPSLDACHEMEKHIIPAGGTHTAYISELQRLTQHEDNPAFSHIWHATAAQKAEAFLKATGHWQP